MKIYLLEGERFIGFVEHTSETWVNPTGNMTYGTWMSLSAAENAGLAETWPKMTIGGRARNLFIDGTISRQRREVLG